MVMGNKGSHESVLTDKSSVEKTREPCPCSQCSEADSSDYESDGEWDNLPELPSLVITPPLTYILT